MCFHSKKLGFSLSLVRKLFSRLSTILVNVLLYRQTNPPPTDPILYRPRLAWRRMRSVRCDDTVCIIGLALHVLPCGLDRRQYLPAIVHERDIGNRLRCVFLGAHGAWVRGVVVVWAGVRADGVAGLGADEGVDVCADVPPAERGEAPVGFYSGDFRVCLSQSCQ